MGWQGLLTHRQFIMWQYWMNEELNNPTRDNYYQMQIACEIRRASVKNPKNVKVDQFKLKFTSSERKTLDQLDPNNPEDRKEIEATKNVFFGFMSAGITVRRNGQIVDTIIPPMAKQKEIQKERESKLVQAKRRRNEKEKENKSNDLSADNKKNTNERRTNIRANRQSRQVRKSIGGSAEENRS